MNSHPQTETTNPEENKTLLDNEIPAKFKDPETGDLNTEKLMTSYKALERKMSEVKHPPKSADDYCIDCAHGMFVPDAEINKRLHAYGLTEEQAQAVYDLAAEKLIPMIMDVAGDFKAEREIEKLIEHYGGAENWKRIARQLLSYGQKHLPGDVLDNLTSSFDGVLALERMMNERREPGLAKSSVASAQNMNAQDLQSMMRDPKYWKEKDPAFIAKVTNGFQAMYSGE